MHSFIAGVCRSRLEMLVDRPMHVNKQSRVRDFKV